MTAKPPKKVVPPKEPDEFCNGRKKDMSGYCGNVAGKKTSHVGVGRCWLHGGAEPHAEANGQVVLARREAAVMGIPLDLPPTHGILECIRITAGEILYASERIAVLSEDEVVGSIVTTLDRPLKGEKGAEYPEVRVQEVTQGPPALHIWVRVRHEAMDRLVQYESAALKAGIEERQVKLAEGIAQRIVEVVRNVVRELGVQDHPELPRIVRKQLTLVAGA